MRTEALREQVTDILEGAIRDGYFPSASVSVFTSGGPLFQLAFGQASVGTLFDVASLTKIATSTQVLMAVEEGLLRLDSRLVDLLPDTLGDPELRERLQPVTVERLLLHNASLPAWYPTYTDGRDFPLMIKTAIFSKPPIEGVEYSDLNFILLGKVLERIHGLRLDGCLREKLVDPLKLGHMCYCPDPSWDIAPSSYGNPNEEEMIAGLSLRFDRWRSHEPLRGQVNDGNAWYYFGGISGHAGIFADAEAYGRLARHYMTSGSPLLIRSMSEQAPTRGLGWQVGELYPCGCGHTGFTGTSVYLSRELDVGCVLLANRLFYPHRNERSTHDIRRALHQAVARSRG